MVSHDKTPGARILVVQVDTVALVRLMQELHIFVELDAAITLDSMLYLEVITRLEKNR